MQDIRMAMNIPTSTLIAKDGMCHLKRKYFSYFHHKNQSADCLGDFLKNGIMIIQNAVAKIKPAITNTIK